MSGGVPRTIASASGWTRSPRSASRRTARSLFPVADAVLRVKRSVSDRFRVSPTWRLTPGAPCRLGYSCAQSALWRAVYRADRPAEAWLCSSTL